MSQLPPAEGIVTTPVFRQLAEALREAILRGDMAAGERVPSERALAERYGVSRATANKVLAALVSEGLLEQRKGIGTFVRTRGTLPQSLRKMKSFTAQALALGFRPRTEVLSFRETRAGDLDPKVRRELELDDEKVLVLERLRLLDDEPAILETRWVPAALLPGVGREDFGGSFYELLEARFGIHLSAENHSVTAVALEAPTARQLGVPAGHAALSVHSTGFIHGRDATRPIWHHHLFMRGDRYSLQSNIETEPNGVSTDLRFLQT